MYHPDPEELRRLIGAINPQSPFGQRDLGWIILCLHTGLRVAELVALNVGQVVDDAGDPRRQLHLPGPICKGKRGRVVPLNATAQKAIRNLLEFKRKRGFSITPGSPLLVNRKHRRLPARAARYVLEKYHEKPVSTPPSAPTHCGITLPPVCWARPGRARDALFDPDLQP